MFVDTGLNTDILQRIKKSEKYCKEYILICYGDTLVNLNINNLIKKHLLNKADLTLSVYNQKISFGVLIIDSNDSCRNCSELYTGITIETNSDMFFIINYEGQKSSDPTF